MFHSLSKASIVARSKLAIFPTLCVPACPMVIEGNFRPVKWVAK
jgi:hypothetical protein